MTTWLNKVKRLLAYYLGAESGKYITTESGKLLQIVDHQYRNKSKS